MRKISLILILFSFSFYAQENKLFDELIKIKSSDKQVSYILNLPIKNLGKSSLIKKLDSKLNTIASCLNSFVYSKRLYLTEKEIVKLKKRIELIAFKFFKSDNYVLLKKSGGYAPTYGVGIDTIAKKKVIIVHLGGDCIIDETDLKWEEITSHFNKKMKSLLNQ